MKLIVMGTGPFAVPTLQWLVEATEYEIDLVVTRPIDDAGKRRKTVANPVREYAESQQLEIFAPRNINDAQAVDKLNSCDADLMFVCDYGQILKRPALTATRLGGINLHGSLLPKYRGAAPINWAIYHGETETGVTVIHMTPRLDGGPSLSQRRLTIEPNETAEQLEPRLATFGVAAVQEALQLLTDWDGTSQLGETQDQQLVTQAPRLQKRQGNIDWSQSAAQIHNQVRAFQPWPGCFTYWLPDAGKALRLIVHQTSWTQEGSSAPGIVQTANDDGIQIGTGQGTLTVLTVQPAGKKPMPVAEFLRGRKVKPGNHFGKNPDQG